MRAARALGVSRRALYRLIAKYHLESPRPEPPEPANSDPLAAPRA